MFKDAKDYCGMREIFTYFGENMQINGGREAAEMRDAKDTL